jgi:hypothetical protein
MICIILEIDFCQVWIDLYHDYPLPAHKNP